MMQDLIGYLEEQGKQEWADALKQRTQDLEAAANSAGAKRFLSDMGPLIVFREEDFEKFTVLAGRHATRDFAILLQGIVIDLRLAMMAGTHNQQPLIDRLEVMRRKYLRES